MQLPLTDQLQKAIEDAFDNKPAAYGEEHFRMFAEFKAALNAGEIRAASPDASAATGWRVNGWVKKGILLGFRLGSIVEERLPHIVNGHIDNRTQPESQQNALFHPTIDTPSGHR